MNFPESEEVAHKPEIINLNEEFILFDPKRTHIERPFYVRYPELTEFLTNNSNEYDQFTSKILLQIPSLPQIPIDIEAETFPKTHQSFGVAPFESEAKEAIAAEDFDLEQRIKKWEKAWQKDKAGEDRGESGIRQESPLELNLRASIYTLHDLGLVDKVKEPIGPNSPLSEIAKDKEYYVIKSGLTKELEDIYLSLIFPLGTWKSESENTRKDGLGFFYFHPSETAPLACNPNGPWAKGGALHKGIPLFVPSELNKLSQIKGKFQRTTAEVK